jgi:5-methyltetrahydropteroyltriglutamate--homocysteine methyltransferase
MNHRDVQSVATLGPLATTSVGSFPRPTWLAHTRRNLLTFQASGEALTEAMDDATIIILREQEELGIDLLTDGEMRRASFIFHVAGQWDGIDTKTLGSTHMFRNRAIDRFVPRIIDKIIRRSPATVSDLRSAKAYTRRPLKMAVPGPMTVIDSTADQFYEDEEELAMDIASAINGEMRDLQTAGCDVLQIGLPPLKWSVLKYGILP